MALGLLQGSFSQRLAIIRNGIGRLAQQAYAAVSTSAAQQAEAASVQGGQKELYVCVVGSGPSGFYTVDRVGGNCWYHLQGLDVLCTVIRAAQPSKLG